MIISHPPHQVYARELLIPVFIDITFWKTIFWINVKKKKIQPYFKNSPGFFAQKPNVKIVDNIARNGVQTKRHDPVQK